MATLMPEPNKKAPATWLLVAGVLLVLCVIGNIVSTIGDAISPEAERAQESAPTTPAKPAAKPAPKFDDGPLTPSTVRAAIELDDARVRFDSRGVLTVTYPLGTVWDEEAAVRTSQENAVAAFRTLFGHPAMRQVTVESQTEFTDPYGKSTVERAVSITWSRATARAVDWEGFEGRLVSDKRAALRIADAYEIHPGMWKDLEDKTMPPFGGN